MENCRYTANKWRIDFLEKRVQTLSCRILSLSKSQMWLSIALAIVSLALFVHILLLHCL